MLKSIVSMMRTFNKVILYNSFNTYNNLPLIMNEIYLSKSLRRSKQQTRSLAYYPNLILGRLHINNKKLESHFESLETKTKLEKHFLSKLGQHFGFTEQECAHIYMICRSALDSEINSTETIDKTIELIANNFTANDVYFNPQIFVIHSRTLMNRTLTLKELGFNDLKIVEIDSCFKEILNETPNKLKSMNLYDKHTNPLQCFLNNIVCPQFLKHQIQNEFISIKNIDLISFSSIRRISIAKYISWKLDIDYEKALNLIDKKYSRISSTCFSIIASNIDLLLTKFQIPAHRLKSNTFLMTTDFNNLVNIFKSNETIGGKRLIELIINYPKVLDTKYSTLAKNIQLLKRFDIKDDQILKCFPVLTLNSETLEKRLLLLKESDDMKHFIKNPRVLKVIVRLKTALDRLERLKASGCLSVSLDHLIGSKQYFETVMLRFDGFKNNRNAFEYYLSKFMEIDYKSVKNQIGSHPYESRLNISNANRIVEFFIGIGLTKDQLVNGIFIVLYEYELVKHQYKLMSNLTDLQTAQSDWKKDPFLLQLLIYYIEKNYGFTGNGVYMTKGKHSENMTVT